MRKHDRSRFNFMLAAIEFIETATAEAITLKNTYAIFLNLVTLAEAACKIGLGDQRHGDEMYKSMPWDSLQKMRGLVHQVHLFDLSELSAGVLQEISQFTQLKTVLQFVVKNDKDPQSSEHVKVLLKDFLDKVASEKITRSTAHTLKTTDNAIMLTIQKELENIKSFLADDPNLKNENTLYAVQMAFAIIANQIKKDETNGTGLSVEFMKEHLLNAPMEGVDPQLLSMWSDLLEFGNGFIHNYHNIDIAKVISICQNQFPIIRKSIQTICSDIHLLPQLSAPVTESTYSTILTTFSETSEITSLPQHSVENKEEEKKEKEIKIKEVTKTPDDLLEQLDEEYQDATRFYQFPGKN